MTKEEQKLKSDEKSTKKNVEESPKKTSAKVHGSSLRISLKYSKAILKIIKNKEPDTAIKILENALSKKRAIPMPTREVGHKRGRGMSSGRYAINACTQIINLIKQVKANASVLGIENPVISSGIANMAQRPYRRGGSRGKRTHISLEVVDKTKLLSKRK